MGVGRNLEGKHMSRRVQTCPGSSAGVHRCTQVSFVAPGLIIEEGMQGGGWSKRPSLSLSFRD